MDDMAVVRKKENTQDNSFTEGFGDFGEDGASVSEGLAEKKRE